jgi:hypothetical protein
MTVQNDTTPITMDTAPETRTLTRQPKCMMKYAAMKGEMPPERLAEAERTLHHVPNCRGENH